MGRHDFRPIRVLQTVNQLLETGRVLERPSWYHALETIPPSEILSRPVHRTQARRRARGRMKPSKMFQPAPIRYPEDKLRRTFFTDHPWELARPKIVAEDTGNDAKGWDWARIQQRGKPLDGESVIQRQLWLMKNKKLSEVDAYDIARKEFYKLRLEEDVQRQVAKEEAQYVGAQFGPGPNEIGMRHEDRSWEDWRRWALKSVETERMALMAAFSATENLEGNDDGAEDELLDLDTTEL